MATAREVARHQQVRAEVQGALRAKASLLGPKFDVHNLEGRVCMAVLRGNPLAEEVAKHVKEFQEGLITEQTVWDTGANSTSQPETLKFNPLQMLASGSATVAPGTPLPQVDAPAASALRLAEVMAPIDAPNAADANAAEAPLVASPTDVTHVLADHRRLPTLGTDYSKWDDRQLLSIPRYNTFISHKRSSAQDFARGLHSLIVHHGHSCFIDVENLESLSDLPMVVAGCDVFILASTLRCRRPHRDLIGSRPSPHASGSDLLPFFSSCIGT